MAMARVTRRRFAQGSAAAAGSLALVGSGLTTRRINAAVGRSLTPSRRQPAAGGSLLATVGCGDIRGWETWQDSTACEAPNWTAVYDTLVEYDDQYNLVGGLFESWETSDAATWSFKVRQGVVWHDGQPLVVQHLLD